MAQAAGYSFNAGTVDGSLVRDLAGSFLHGTITGSAAISSAGGKYGDGLNCTGGAMVIANIDQFSYPVNDDGGLTIAAWVKLNDNTAAARCIASATSGGSLIWAVYASNATGNVELKLAGTTYSTTTSIRDGAYHHVMIVHDKVPATDTVTIYVDGTSVLSTTATTSLTHSSNVTINWGRNALSSGEALNGILDDCRHWNDPVESTYVSTVKGAEQVDFQFAIYGFDDDTADDLSIYNRDLTVAPSATFSAGLYGRVISSSTTEAAASGAVAFGDLDRLAFTGWMRLDIAPTGSAKPILAINSSTGVSKMRVVVNLDRTITATWVTIYGTYSVTSGSALTVGQWSRFQISMNPTYVDIRLNSTTQAITNTSNAIPHLTPAVLDLNTLYVGGDQAGGGQVSFDYLNLTKNFVAAASNLYWIGPVNQTAVKPANVARGVYEFNENAGTTAADKSSFANTLTLQTGAGWTPGVQGSALAEGTATGPAAEKTGLAWSASPLGWSFAGWFKTRASSAGARILVLRNGTNEVAHAFYLSGAFQMRLFGSGGTTGIMNPAGGSFSSETWTHLAGSCNGSTVQFFKNGVKYGSVDFTVGPLLSPTILRVGGDDSGEGVADTDSLQLFDTPISPSNVAWLFANPGLFIASTSVTATRATTWRAAARVTATRATTWDTLTGVTAARSSTWRAASRVTGTRVTSWDTLGSITATRASSWRATQRVTGTRASTWRTRAALTATRASTWNVVATASLVATRSTSWAVAGPVTATCTATWDTRATVAPATRATTWDSLARLTAGKATTWRSLSRSTATRLTRWAVDGDVEAVVRESVLTTTNHPSSVLTVAPPSQLEVTHGV